MKQDEWHNYLSPVSLSHIISVLLFVVSVCIFKTSTRKYVVVDDWIDAASSNIKKWNAMCDELKKSKGLLTKVAKGCGKV